MGIVGGAESQVDVLSGLCCGAVGVGTWQGDGAEVDIPDKRRSLSQQASVRAEGLNPISRQADGGSGSPLKRRAFSMAETAAPEGAEGENMKDCELASLSADNPCGSFLGAGDRPLQKVVGGDPRALEQQPA